ncbi:hypothetical protein D3C71_89590 [compost metagenome]
MERQLPTYQIGNIPFIVDVDYNLLRHPGDERHTISFFDDLEDKGTHYHLYLDPLTGECTSYRYLDKDTEYIQLQVPQMVKLDPEGIAAKYSISIGDIPDRDSKLYMNPDLFRQREMGKLPVMDICGHPFYIDVRIDLLRPKDDFSTMGINISDLEVDDSGTKYLFLYQPETHRRVSIDKHMTEIPKGIVALEIPFENILDSYAVARQRGLLDSMEWFRKYPVRTGLKARIIPWEQTSLPKLIQKNREAKGMNRRKGKRL